MNIAMPIGTRTTISVSMIANMIEPIAIPLTCGSPRLRLAPLRSSLCPQRGSNSRLGTALRRSSSCASRRDPHVLRKKIEACNREERKARNHQCLRDPDRKAENRGRLSDFLDPQRTGGRTPRDQRAEKSDKERAQRVKRGDFAGSQIVREEIDLHVAAHHVAIGEERCRRERRAHLQELDVARNRPRKDLAADDRHDLHHDHRDENKTACDRKEFRYEQQRAAAWTELRSDGLLFADNLPFVHSFRLRDAPARTVGSIADDRRYSRTCSGRAHAVLRARPPFGAAGMDPDRRTG